MKNNPILDKMERLHEDVETMPTVDPYLLNWVKTNPEVAILLEALDLMPEQIRTNTHLYFVKAIFMGWKACEKRHQLSTLLEKVE
jgi:hypothetical protein